MLSAAMKTMGDWARLDTMLWGLVGFQNKMRPKVEEAAQALVTLMKVSLRDGRFGLIPNTPLTSELKMSSSPGVDSGAMLGAIDSTIIAETKDMVVAFVGIPNDAGDGGYPGPVSENFWAVQGGQRIPGFWQPWYSSMKVVDVAHQFVIDKVINIPTVHGRITKFVPGRDFVTPAFETWKAEWEDKFPTIVHRYLKGLVR